MAAAQFAKKHSLDSYPAVCPKCRTKIHLYTLKRINAGQDWTCYCERPKATPSQIRAQAAVLLTLALAHPLHR